MKKEILKKQFLAIDLTKVVLSLFVVQIHCFNLLPASASPRFYSSLYDFCRILFSQGICRLAVPTFFLISGYLFWMLKDKGHYDDLLLFFKNKIFRLFCYD